MRVSESYKQFCVTAAFLLCAASVFPGAAVASSGVAALSERFDVVVREQNAESVLEELARLIGVPVVLSDEVDGIVSLRATSATGREIFDKVAIEAGLDWRYDGRRIEITSQTEQVSRALSLGGVKRERLIKALDDAGLYDSKFPIKTVEDRLAIVSGPPRYVAVIEVVLAELAQTVIEEPAVDPAELARQEQAARLELLREEARIRAAERAAILESRARERAEIAQQRERQRLRDLERLAAERAAREANRLPVVVRGSRTSGG